MNLTEIKIKPISELVEIATELGLEDVGRLKKQEIIFKIFKHKGFSRNCIICVVRREKLVK